MAEADGWGQAHTIVRAGARGSDARLPLLLGLGLVAGHEAGWLHERGDGGREEADGD